MKKIIITFYAAFIAQFLLFANNHIVNTQGMNFVPSSIVIDIGDTVTFNNTSGFHNVNGTTTTFGNGAGSSIDDSSTATFSVGVSDATDILVFVGGVYQVPTTNYSISGSGLTAQITFGSAPPTNDGATSGHIITIVHGINKLGQ